MIALTERQRECVRLAANGYSNLEIARGLGRGRSRVRHILTDAYGQLGLYGHTSRVRAAILLLDEEFPAWRGRD